MVRQRLEGISAAAGVDLSSLPIDVITAPIYMRRQRDRLTLSTEHRAAVSQDHIPLHLHQEGLALALSVLESETTPADPPGSPVQRVRQVLAQLKEPASVQHLRQLCGMKTATLCAALAQLSDQGLVSRDTKGYQLRLPFEDPLVSLSHPIDPQGNGNGKRSLCSSGG